MGHTFSPGERIVCILNNRASLTVGREYVVQKSSFASLDMGASMHDSYVDVVSDAGELMSYSVERFMPLSDFRSLKISQLNKDAEDDNN